MIDLHLSAFAPRWRFLYVVRIDAYITTILPRPIPTLDSVVYNDSTFGREKQENDKSARILTLLDFFRAAKETVEPPGSQSYNANTSSRGQTDWRSNDEL